MSPLPVNSKASFGQKILSLFKKSEKTYTEKEWIQFIQENKPLKKLSYTKVKNSFHNEDQIPLQLRGEIWKLICNVHQIKSKNKLMYQNLLQ